MGRYGKRNSRDFVEEDYDSSNEDNVTSFEEANRQRKNVISKLKEKIHDYRKPENVEARRIKKLEKQDKKIEALERKAKIEKLKGSIRVSKNAGRPKPYGASSGIGSTSGLRFPKQNYDSMDEMLGFGSRRSTNSRSKKTKNKWAGMDRMLGFGK